MSETVSANDRLNSWKEIATHLDRDVRTLMRWEKEKRLPIHRVPGGQRKSVFAYRKELDAWLHNEISPGTQAENGNENSNRTAAKGISWSLGGLAVLGTVVCAIFATLYYRSSTQAMTRLPERVGFTADALEVFDGRDRLIWAHHFQKTIELSYMGNVWNLVNFTRIADLKGDGDREVLAVVPLRSAPDPTSTPIAELDCFSSQGELLWSYVPDNTFQFGTSGRLTGPWNILDVLVAPEGQSKSLWVVAAHREWGNSFVAQLDARTGKGEVRFVNAGVIYKLNEMKRGGETYLLAAGFNNEYGAGSLSIMNERKTFAASPQTSGSRYECKSCPEGSPDYYLVFPRSEINEIKEVWEDSLRSVEFNGRQIEIRKFPLNEQGAVYSEYVLQTDPTVFPLSLQFSSRYDMLHRDLEVAGRIHHPVASCPERSFPKPVKLWKPRAGWVEFRVPAVE